MPAKLASAKTVTLNAATLERLGAPRLAELVMELSASNAVIKRRLKIELSGPQGAAHAIAKRLATITKSKSYVDWRKVKVMQTELLDQRAAIMAVVAPTDPGTALDLMWQFMGVAEPLLDRTFDMSGSLVYLFRDSVPMLGTLALAAKPPPGLLAAKVKDALLSDGYGQYDGLIGQIGEALGEEGLLILADQFIEAGNVKLPQSERAGRMRACESALQEIADARGDVDAFIRGMTPESRKGKAGAAMIAMRLLAADRAGEVLIYLDACTELDARPCPAWEAARADVLTALGRQADAQAFRWQCFKTSLNADLLRAHIKALPDFDDEDALDKALLYAQSFPDFQKAITFLTDWPSLKHAAARIVADPTTPDGNQYEWLTELGKTLDENHPLAATLVRRAMITFALTHAKSKRYKYVARHIRECAVSAGHIDDWKGHWDHETWITPLMRDHARKFGVWDLV